MQVPEASPEEHCKTIPDEYKNFRLDVVLTKLFPDFSRSMLSRWLKDGVITLNSNLAKPKDKVLGGEIIELKIPIEEMAGIEDKPENIPLDIIFEDEHLLVINKQEGLVVHPGAGNREHTLVNALLYHDKNLQSLPRAGIVHRLDKDTTGLLVIAKNLKVLNLLVNAMQAREIKRCYQALVYGRVISGAHLETFYGRHPRSRLKMSVLKGGKIAITDYRINRSFANFTLLDVSLVTGRTHQIRVHMAHINHPIVGDPLYGGQRSRLPRNTFQSIRDALMQFKRQALHAASLTFTHPITEQLMIFEAPLPQDYQKLLNALDVKLSKNEPL